MHQPPPTASRIEAIPSSVTAGIANFAVKLGEDYQKERETKAIVSAQGPGEASEVVGSKKNIIDNKTASAISAVMHSERLKEYENIVEATEDMQANMLFNLPGKTSLLTGDRQTKSVKSKNFKQSVLPTEKEARDRADVTRYNVDKENINNTRGATGPSTSVEDTKSVPGKSKLATSWIISNKQLAFYGNDQNMFSRFKTAIDKIHSTDSGKELLGAIETISRRKSEKLNVEFYNYQDNYVIARNRNDASNVKKGSGSTFSCNLDQAGLNEGLDRATSDAIVVYHELVHVLHNLWGERLVPRVSDKVSESAIYVFDPIIYEEARTTGLGSFSNEAVSENKFRKEIGVPLRESYPSFSCEVKNDDTIVIKRDEMATGEDKKPEIRPLWPYP